MVLTTAAEAGADAPAATQWVVFRCAGRRFGVPLARVTEIIVPQPFTRLPGADAAVCGLVGVRGRVVTVLDFGVLLGVRSSGAQPDHRLLLLDLEGRRIGAAVDDVVEIVPARVAPGDGTAADAGIPADAVLGTGRSDDGVFTAIAPHRLTAGLLNF